MVDQDCVRVLLLYLDRHFSPADPRKQPKALKLKNIVSQSPLDGYPAEEIYQAARYIVTMEFVKVAAKKPHLVSHLAADEYIFTSITPTGLKVLSALREESDWKKLSAKLGNVFDAALPQILAAAKDLILG